jgi:hypothetical protein
MGKIQAFLSWFGRTRLIPNCCKQAEPTAFYRYGVIAETQ